MEAPHPSARQSLKRKLTEDQTDPYLCAKVLFYSADGAAVKSAVLVLAKLPKNELLDVTLIGGTVSCLVSHLRPPEALKDDAHELEKGCAHILGLLATNPSHQNLIIDAGALPCLVDLLRRHKISTISPPLFALIRTLADAIKNLAFGSTLAQTVVRMEGGIPLLVELLEFNVTKVQRAAALALGALAYKNDDNKKQIVECNALPALVLMLQVGDPTIQHAAVNAIGNLISFSPDFTKEVLLAGALQPVICLLRSCCSECQKEAAWVLGHFALDPDCKVHISQRGAIPPLVDMLKSPDTLLWRPSGFALGNLAQDSHNQAAIAHNGGIEPLLNLLLPDSSVAPLQRDLAFALSGLADNEEIVPDIIKAGVFAKVKHGHFKDQPTKEWVAITFKRLEEKMQGQVLKRLIYLMRFEKKRVQRHVAIALAYLCSPHDRKTIFVDNNGLELLLDMFESPNIKQKHYALAALHKLVAKASSSVSLFDAASPSSTLQMYSNEEYVKDAYIRFIMDKFYRPKSKPWYCPLVNRIVTDMHMFFSTLLIKSHPADS